MPLNDSAGRGLVLVIMGVAGSGKTTVGRALAQELDAPFLEGDDFHPSANRRRMRAGIPLTDADRWPWLDRVAEGIRKAATGAPVVVIACSALKKRYREHLRGRAGPRIEFIYLRGNYELISRRLETRTGHFMPADLLHSQFDDLEEPEHAIVADIDAPVETIVDRIVAELRQRIDG
ncbi:MAG: gluconokinase [Gammaproteobacteria bacterium]